MAGINVMEEMARRRSSMASTLAPMLPGGGGSAAPQQSMAPPQQAAPAQQQAAPQQMPPENMAGGMPQSIAQLRQMHQDQNASIEARGQDLRLAQMLMRALDPGMPKGFRQLGMKNISQTVGVDPRGDTAKEIINTITGLDPESLEGLRRGLASASTDAPPGEITKMLKGTLTGQVPPDQLLDMAAAAVQQQGGGEEETPMMRLGAAPPPTTDLGQESMVTPVQAPGQADAPGAPLPPRTPGPAAMPFDAAPSSGIPRYRENEVSPRNREIIPELAAVLGLDPSVAYRNSDVMKIWPRVRSSGESQEKMTADISNQQDGAVNTMVLSSALSRLIGDRPEVLGSGMVDELRGGGGFWRSMSNTNIPSFAVQLNDTLRSLNVFVPDGALQRIIETDPMYNTEVGKQLRSAGDKLGGMFRGYFEQIGEAAEVNARVRSLLIPLAFAMAAAKGQGGRFLSDRDVALQIEEIGNSRSPRQFQAALKDMTARIYDGYQTRMQTFTGGEVPLIHAFTPEARRIVSEGGIAPAALITQLGVQNVNADQGPPTGQGTVTPPPAGEPSPNRFGAPPGALPGTAPEPAAPVTPSGPPQPTETRRRIPRSSPTIEEEGQARVRLQEEDRAYVHEARGHNERRMAIAESSERRAQRQEVESRREKIRAAFAQIGASLRGHASGGGGSAMSGMGGDQDPAAFRVKDAPRRAAPAPVNAAPYQMQPRRRGGG